MQKCKTCNHEFGYIKMCTAIRTVQCPSCGSKHLVLAKNIYIFIAVIAIGVMSISYLEDLLPEGMSWFAYVIVIPVLALCAPFNQRLKKIEQE